MSDSDDSFIQESDIDEANLSREPVDSHETEVESTLRPHTLEEFVGQPKTTENLEVFIEAAGNRNEALDHVLLHGPPGLGKTTLAQIIAEELGVNLKRTAGPSLERPGDLVAILTNLQDRAVLFIDEIHRLNNVVEEFIYPAMEDQQIDITIGEGPSARTATLDLDAFTLVGATTRAGLLTQPMRSRFGVQCRLDFYNEEEMGTIIRRSADILEIEIDGAGVEEIARRSRGTPRIANRLLRRVRDFAQVEGEGVIDEAIANHALERLEVDGMGLSSMDRTILSTIIHHYEGGPVGVDTLATAVSEESGTIEELHEPYLIQSGFLKRTPRGRVATERAYEHIGEQTASDGSRSLFE